jgi:hypothetical protein
VTLLGLCTVAGGVLGPKIFRNKTWFGAALVVLLGAYAISMFVRPSTLSLAPIGPEMTSRFFGVSNLLETWLLFPSLLGAALLARRFGPLAFVGVAGLSLATIAENSLGADGGGAIVVGVAFALLAVVLLGARKIYTLPALGISALLVLALVNIDAAASGPDHLRGALTGGFDGLANVAANRVPLAYNRMIEQWWLLIPLTALVGVGLAVTRSGRSRSERAVAVALLGALVASFLVNDSPGPVALAGLAAVLSLDGGLVHRVLALPVLRRLPQPVADVLPQEP